MMTPATITAAGTAASLCQRAAIAQAAMMASAAMGASATARTGAKHKPNKIPASMALASDAGIAATARPSGFHKPAKINSNAQMMKAPTASAKPPAGMMDAAISAAPGVDQAQLIGIRFQSDSKTPQSPMAMETAISPDAAWDGLAPIATKPCSTTAKEEAKPTTPANSPADMACIGINVFPSALYPRQLQ